MFNQQLVQAKEQLQHQQTLPLQVQKVADLSTFGSTLSPNKQFMEFDADDLFGEFSHKNKHYHYMKLSDGLLVMDVTEKVVVKRGAKDMITILVLLLIPCIALSVYLAKTISAHALRPFHRLSQHFQQRDKQQNEPLETLIDIEEADVKIIAQQLEQALAKQTLLIEEQAMFNQGMSHEIRTPLQVMSHSLELFEVNYAELYTQPLVQRLVKSIARIKRISNALLWLTSKDQCQDKSPINEVLDRVLFESKNLITAHNLDITLNNINKNQPTVTMPEEVLELIFFNLLNNTIHHGMHSNDSNELTITIEKNSVMFSNEIVDTISEQQHFNLGLNLIKKLAERFNNGFTTEVTNNQFNATLYFD